MYLYIYYIDTDPFVLTISFVSQHDLLVYAHTHMFHAHTHTHTEQGTKVSGS